MSTELKNYRRSVKIEFMKELVADNFTVKYNYGAVAARKISFEAGRGEIFVVYGETESGKTSLLKGIAGLAPVVGGDVYIGGEKINCEKKIRDSNVCMIMNDGGFFERKTVKYNVLYPLSIRKIPVADREKILSKVFKIIPNLRDLIEKRPKELSPAERIRVSFARSLVREAKVCLIDNPLFALTGAEREKMFAEITGYMNMSKRNGAVVYATDKLEEFKKIGGNGMMLEYGIAMQQGTPEEMSDFPANYWILKKFHPESEEDGTIIRRENGSLVCTAFGKDYPLKDEYLLSGVFIERRILAVKVSEKLFLFDPGSERIIYYCC